VPHKVTGAYSRPAVRNRHRCRASVSLVAQPTSCLYSVSVKARLAEMTPGRTFMGPHISLHDAATMSTGSRVSGPQLNEFPRTWSSILESAVEKGQLQELRTKTLPPHEASRSLWQSIPRVALQHATMAPVALAALCAVIAELPGQELGRIISWSEQHKQTRSYVGRFPFLRQACS
jgi:hypothetical protein